MWVMDLNPRVSSGPTMGIVIQKKKKSYPWNCQVNYKRNKKKNGIACLMASPISDKSWKRLDLALY